MPKVLLGLGSNKGDRSLYIASAIKKLNTQLGRVTLTASIYETAAWGKTDQDAFLNSAVIVQTIYSPIMCFKIIKQIEQQLGRQFTEHWGPREIDLDILLYDDLVMDTDVLTIPHAEMHNRNFVLVPCAEIAPNWMHPKLSKTLRKLVPLCQDELAVQVWKK